VLWTGVGSLIKGDLTLSSNTYLWMFPIYGLAVFLEPVHDQIEDWPWYGRGLVWAGLILIIEYTTGWFLRSGLGECPWDYSTSTAYHLQGLIRLDYLPVWFVVGLIFERVHRALDQYYLRD
jgi:uncharacterized membrane protein